MEIIKKIFITFVIIFFGLCSSITGYAEENIPANTINAGEATIVAGGVLATVAAIAGLSHSSSANNQKIIYCGAGCQRDLQAILDKWRQKYNFSAMSMSISLSFLPDQPIFDFYSGTTTKNGGIPVTAASLFEIGSLTKLMVAVLILQLEAEGSLQITDTVSHWFSSPSEKYDDWGTATIKQLLNHTSGIYNYVSAPGFLDEMFKNPTPIWSLYDLIQVAYANIPNKDFEPGAGWSYSNTPYQLAGEIIERITGKTLKENLEKRIFNPLNLQNTIYDTKTSPVDFGHNMVHGYYEDKDPAQYYGRDITYQNMSWASAAGGVISTTHDYTKFIRALFSGQILPAKQFSEMTSLVCMEEPCKKGAPISPDIAAEGYGLGVKHEKITNGYPVDNYWYHTGTVMGFHNIFYYIPKNDFIITIFGNERNHDIDDYDYTQLVGEVYQYLFTRGLVLTTSR